MSRLFGLWLCAALSCATPACSKSSQPTPERDGAAPAVDASGRVDDGGAPGLDGASSLDAAGLPDDASALDAGARRVDAGEAYCPPLPPEPARDLGRCPGPDGGLSDAGVSRHSLTLEVIRGRTFVDPAVSSRDAVGRLVAAVFDVPILCKGCTWHDPVASAVGAGADLRDPTHPAVLVVNDVPEGGSWILAWLDDATTGTSGPFSIDEGDLFTFAPATHLTCADATVRVSLDHRMARLHGDVSIAPGALAGDTTGSLAVIVLPDSRLGAGARDPMGIFTQSGADLASPLPYEIRGFLGTTPGSLIGIVPAPALVYYVGALDADESGGDPTPGDVLAIDTGLLGARGIARCLDDTTLDFTQNVELTYRIPAP